jgi:hypothetical protein
MGNNHGGIRDGAGPKLLPRGECKKIVTVYIEQDFIDEWGGRKKLQEDIKHFVYKELQKGKW